MAAVVLHGFWASSCTWRARAALLYKGVRFEERAVDIVKAKEHLTDHFRAINPAQKVPALEIEKDQPLKMCMKSERKWNLGNWLFTDGHTLVESMAILQYLEDTRPLPSLTPKNALLGARMREIIEIIVSGIQPLQNIALRPHFSTEEQYQQFGQFWTRRGLQALEELLAKSSGQYCVGDQLTMADLCLVPQVSNALGRLKLDIDKFPTVSKLYWKLLKEPIFAETHPKKIKSLL